MHENLYMNSDNMKKLHRDSLTTNFHRCEMFKVYYHDSIIIDLFIVKDTINPLQLFVEKHQFFNQNNQ